MGVLGETVPGPRIRDEATEAGDGDRWRLGPIDLEKGVVELHPPAPSTDDEPEPDPR